METRRAGCRTCGQTAGTCGQAACTCGQTAGTCGQAAGTCRQTAGTCGQTASTCRQTAGTCGQTAGTCGQTAGTCGQAAGAVYFENDRFDDAAAGIDQAARRAAANVRPEEDAITGELLDRKTLTGQNRFADEEITRCGELLLLAELVSSMLGESQLCVGGRNPESRLQLRSCASGVLQLECSVRANVR